MLIYSKACVMNDETPLYPEAGLCGDPGQDSTMCSLFQTPMPKGRFGVDSVSYSSHTTGPVGALYQLCGRSLIPTS